jgi:hypothetical protein
MDHNEKAVEDAIQAAGKTAPRVTMADIDGEIVSAHYFTAAEAKRIVAAGSHGLSETETNPPALRCLTFCVLVLRNGFTVTGESACASPENFDAAIGASIAYRNAREKIWPLLGFRLRDRIKAADSVRDMMLNPLPPMALGNPAL